VARDPDLVLIGTGADEVKRGIDGLRAQAERDWSQTDALAFDLEWHSISAAGPVAWLAGGITIRGRAGAEDILLPNSRLTLVLEQRGGRWLIVHAHFSLPAAGQAEGQSMPT
jgi:ketosteroid isomerase-like protein